MPSIGAPSLIGGFSITSKLTFCIAGAALFAGFAIGGIALWSAGNLTTHAAKEHLLELSEGGAQSMEAYIKRIDGDLIFLQSSQLGGRSFSDMSRGWDSLQGDKQAFLKRAYIEENPNSKGEKQLLKDTGANDAYAAMHSKHHMSYRAFQETHGYYDLFLINKRGDIIYSVFKEDDFAENLIDGPLATSGLATAFQKALKNPTPGKIAFSDLEAYAPSHGAAAGFFAIPLIDTKGEIMGVLALQSPNQVINELVSRYDNPAIGLRAFLVGGDGLLRSDVPDTQAEDSITTRYSSEAIENARMGTAAIAQSISILGKPALAAATNFDIHGITWAFVQEESLTGINQKVAELRNTILFAILPCFLGICVLGWLVARSFAKPIVAISNQVSRLASGESTNVPGLDRGDEIGDLARSLGAINDRAVESQRIASALAHSEAMIMITDQSMNIVYVNDSLKKGLTPVMPVLQKMKPGLTMETLVGINADVFHHTPENNREAVSQPRSAAGEPIKIGHLYFSLSITTMRDRKGGLIGYGVTWLDRTDSLDVERQVASVMDAVAKGDFSQRLKLKTSVKFMADVAEGVNRICEVSDAFLNEMNDVMSGVSAGELTRRMAATHIGTLADVAQNVNVTIAKIGDLVSDIKRASNSMGTTTSSIADGAQDLSGRTEAQASSLEETAATMEEMTANVKANAENSGKANRLANEAADRARGGKDVMQDAVSAMSLIEESSNKISDIISVIESIAFQTNLLALNAAVEAARAGEAGKGFAVVAAEVRTLAQRSSQAAKDIKSLIQDSSEHVGQGVKLVTSTGDALQEIVQAIAKVAETIGDISSASQEQSAGVEEISIAISHMDEMTQKNSTLAEESAAAARGLQNETAWLVDLVSFFKVDEMEAKTARKVQAAPTRATAPFHAPASVRQSAPMKPAARAKVALPSRPAAMPAKPALTAARPIAPSKPAAVVPAKVPQRRPTPRSVAATATATAADKDWSEF
jgi:methyl-accepting chemotaxis protein